MEGFNLALVESQRMEIQALNALWGRKIAVFYGAELNIGLEGELDYPDTMIEHFDVVMASIQSDTDQDLGIGSRGAWSRSCIIPRFIS